MREIKFRAWDKEEKIMLGVVVKTLSGILLDSRNRYELTQYTGLKDKNGNEIYEGDILKNCRFKDSYAEVIWSNDVVSPETEPVKGIFGEYTDLTGFFSKLGEFILKWPDGKSHKAYHIQDTEIIGNIYSNPDLIK